MNENILRQAKKEEKTKAIITWIYKKKNSKNFSNFTRITLG